MRIVRAASQWTVLFPSAASAISLEELSLRCGYRICEVCRKLRCSERYLYEVAKRDMGLPPKLWMRQERMVRARTMLVEGATNEEAADQLGFASGGSFRREFVKIYGLCPVDYAKGLEEACESG